MAIVAGTEAPEPLLEVEVAEKIARLLRQHGYHITTKESAKYLLSCWFGMDSGQTYTGMMPVYEPGDIVSTHMRSSSGRWKTVTTQLPGYTYYMPYSYTIFPKYLSLTLYDNKLFAESKSEDHHEAIIWRCTGINADYSTDLRWRLNHLLIACFKYFGKDTYKQKLIHLSDHNSDVKELAQIRPR